MSHYPHLFSPLTINGMTLKNRIIMPPMGTNMATLNGEVSQEQLEYYELRAKGGTGLITIENICIDFPFASNGTTQLRIDNDQYIPRLFKLTETLHKHGACVSIQLNHAGASAYAYRLEGQTPLSSSTTPSKKHGNIPRPMTHEEIYHAVEKFGDAAERVRRAGFDCVEIHAGHSYLISQFLSPLFNKRTDEFGGSVENRTRILSLIVDKVRACVGPRFPVSLRISADDFLKGGNTLEDSLRILELCQEKVDIINVSAAQNDNLNLQIDQMSLEDGWKRYLSRAVRDKFHKPTVIAGNIRTPQVAEDILASGDADLIAIGRGLIAEPEWVQKVQGGKERLMRKCISCNIGCADHRIARSRPLRCSINPDIIHGDAYKMRRVNRDTNVVVIGAGTAGMEAACTAAEVGCHTWLLEAKNHVGGLATLSKKSAAPVYVTRGVSHILTCPVVAFTAGDTLEFAGCTVRSFSTSHDAVDPVGYRVDAPDGSLGILTDTGFVTDAARESLAGVDTLLLEANHDVETLQYGPYPYFLKRRILGDGGHLSNDAAAEFARLAVQSGTRDILLAHLSKENNTPELAEYAVARALQSAGLSVRLGVAPRDTMSEVHLCRRSPSFASAN